MTGSNNKRLKDYHAIADAIADVILSETLRKGGAVTGFSNNYNQFLKKILREKANTKKHSRKRAKYCFRKIVFKRTR